MAIHGKLTKVLFAKMFMAITEMVNRATTTAGMERNSRTCRRTHREKRESLDMLFSLVFLFYVKDLEAELHGALDTRLTISKKRIKRKEAKRIRFDL